MKERPLIELKVWYASKYGPRYGLCSICLLIWRDGEYTNYYWDNEKKILSLDQKWFHVNFLKDEYAEARTLILQDLIKSEMNPND